MEKAPNRVLLNRRTLLILNGAGDGIRTHDVQLGKLGDVLVLAGDLGEARRRYAASLGIDEKLAEENPASAEARRDVIVSLAKLGQLTGEREYWQQALAVATALEAEGRLAPRDQWMLGDLAERAGGGAVGGMMGDGGRGARVGQV